MSTRTVTFTDLKGGDTLADGDYVLSATWGHTRKRAVVVEVQHPDGTTGRRYFADDAAIEVQAPAEDVAGTFLVGLPVVVTIDEAGRVTLTVCTMDASSAVSEEDDSTDAQVAAVEAAIKRRVFTVCST